MQIHAYVLRRISSEMASFQKCKRTKLNKKEKYEEAKLAARVRRQDFKRRTEDFAHYENSGISDYYFENGFRKVYPYDFVFKAYVKRRWIDRSLFDVLQSEFNFTSLDLISRRCESGDIKVNDAVVSPDYNLKDSDIISHKLHRHELPVLDSKIPFIFEDDDLLVLSKPASIPVHPCGQYTLNSIIHILCKEYGRRPLRFVHRLDRMTSGLLLVAKNYDASLRLASQIGAREVKKYYICRAEGHFPDKLDATNLQSSEETTGVVECSQPLGPLCPKMGLHAVMNECNGGKPACTRFIRLAYEPESQTSLVLCRLFTGRTHQIRIHLQYLGYPIVDDPLYNSTDWGDKKGKGAEYGMTIEEVIERISNSRSVSAYMESAQVLSSSGAEMTPFDHFKNRINSSSLEPSVQERLLHTFNAECPSCLNIMKDPKRNNLVLQLHAYRYSGSDWSYTAPLPDWAIETARASSVSDLTELIESTIAKL
ncbi:unnamed protein product [Calicophoron daubneyi]|uniref:Pseudouridine synthase n=1 Tax=Calicophoron daubneyi TaxID=300641 RepID=A0AAV2TVR0_CALDB